MRAIWTGAITFGLISIPVKLYSAVGEQRVHFRMLRESDGSPIHFKRVAEKDGREVEWKNIVKGFEYEDGKYVTFTHDELDELDVDSIRVIDIDAFVDLEDIDPVFYEKAYYVAPVEGGEKAYRLLAEALEEQNRVGVAKFAMREKEHLCALRVRDGKFVLQTLHWPAEIRNADIESLKNINRVKVSSREKAMAGDLIEQLAGKFEPGRYRNEFERKVKAVAKRKAKGEEVVRAPEPKAEEQDVSDLMAMLEQSLTAARSGKKPKPKSKASSAKSGGNGNGTTRSKYAKASKDDLLKLARKQDIPGRSDMTKDELAKALAKVD
jgi:DNA end-binding protein Ku